ncbi:phosphopantetheine-binding protein [Ketobacter sp.]|uniref:phosphopantetheine-binding protein n=1 Tax=Ketobacter sp. TaxID=2083498 RepID=UPI000F145DC9|nr:phosphopantetheine-binding protein [Ketobacter sp.]RLT95072.1 MAG: acyl carrier protein [Ketobacter sp.]
MQRTDIIQHLVQLLNVDAGRVTETSILTDLVVDSFALIEMVIALQEALNITLVQEDLDGVKTVGQLLDVCAAKLA